MTTKDIYLIARNSKIMEKLVKLAQIVNDDSKKDESEIIAIEIHNAIVIEKMKKTF